MFGLSYEDIVEQIEKKGISRQEIEKRIQEKLSKLSDLISKEGAAHIVANEVGVKLEDLRDFKIGKLQVGMGFVNIKAKVSKLYDVREFKKGEREGKVASFLVGDDSGLIRVVLWDNNHIKKVEDGEIKEESCVAIEGGYVRDNNGFKEVHLGNKGDIKLINEEIQVIDKPVFSFNRKKISELNEGESNIGIFGTIVQVFEPRFYNSCSQCGKKLSSEGDKFKCEEHGIVSGVKVPILNMFFDDGTGNIRTVAFRNQVERLLEGNIEEMEFDTIKEKLLGKQLVLIGRVVKNEMFMRNEFTIQRVLGIKPEEILETIK